MNKKINRTIKIATIECMAYDEELKELTTENIYLYGTESDFKDNKCDEKEIKDEYKTIYGDDKIYIKSNVTKIDTYKVSMALDSFYNLGRIEDRIDSTEWN